MGALALILELCHAVCDDSVRKGTLGGSRCNFTVIIIGQMDGFFEAEVITAKRVEQSIAMQQDVVRSTALNPPLKNSLYIKLLLYKK